MRCARSRRTALVVIGCIAGLRAQSVQPGDLATKEIDPTHVVLLRHVMIGNRPDGLTLSIVNKTSSGGPVELDRFREGELAATPRLEVIGNHLAYLHFYSDYGFYQGSIKYAFDLAGGKPVKTRYGILAFTSVAHENGKLHYAASFGQAGQVAEGWRERHATIVVEPHNGADPTVQIVEREVPMEPVSREPAELRGAGGEIVKVQNVTPPGQPHRPSAIFVNGEPFAAPVPTLELYHRSLPLKQSPAEVEGDIGPFVQSGDTIWFATTFYDGEGVSGIGAIGSFDIAARKYQMRYLPQIAPWSGSAMMLDGDDLWIGLKRRPEGADISGGLLRYNIQTGAVKRYASPDVVFTIDRLGDAIYCGSSHGLYMIRGGQVAQFRIEPDETGQSVMIRRDVPQQRAARGNAR